MTRLGTFLISVVVITTYMTLMPSVASAQSGFAGIVKDPTGAILPGVTVEASSPALIEGRRSAVTDEKGQYKIIDLRPGAYTVTFTLPICAAVGPPGRMLSPRRTRLSGAMKCTSSASAASGPLSAAGTTGAVAFCCGAAAALI